MNSLSGWLINNPSVPFKEVGKGLPPMNFNVLLIITLLLLSPTVIAIEDNNKKDDCTGAYKGKKLTKQEISNVIASHNLFLRKRKKFALTHHGDARWLASLEAQKLPTPAN